MLENLKSVYILKIFFSNLIEKRILLLITHNKRLQSKLGKSLINYKTFSKQYIVYESSNKGKVYNAYDDSIVFEGEYSNGKRNGKGIEYYNNGRKKFEGEYLNGKRHGKGIEYSYDGYCIFEGEYLNGEKNGKGIEYKKNGDKIFIGEYLNGERWKAKLILYGNGTKTGLLEYVNGQIWNMIDYDDNDKIIAEFKEGKGYKKFFCRGKLRIEGEYLNGKRNGIFKQYDYDGHLEHEIEYIFGKLWNAKKYDKDNKITDILINGKGFMEEYEYGEEIFNKIFEGEYLNGERNGKGKEYVGFTSLIFEGEYLNGKRKIKI